MALILLCLCILFGHLSELYADDCPNRIQTNHYLLYSFVGGIMLMHFYVFCDMGWRQRRVPMYLSQNSSYVFAE